MKQDIVSVSAAGERARSSQVLVTNGAQVKRGDLLFRIDPAPFRVALEQAQAQLAAARAADDASCGPRPPGTGADIVGAQANLAIKRNALGRQQALLKQGFTTRADYEDALNEVRTAETGARRRARPRRQRPCRDRARRAAVDRPGPGRGRQGAARPVAHRSPRADGRRRSRMPTICRSARWP